MSHISAQKLRIMCCIFEGRSNKSDAENVSSKRLIKKWITILDLIRVGNKPNLWLFTSHNCSTLYREQNDFDIDLFLAVAFKQYCNFFESCVILAYNYSSSADSKQIRSGKINYLLIAKLLTHFSNCSLQSGKTV